MLSSRNIDRLLDSTDLMLYDGHRYGKETAMKSTEALQIVLKELVADRDDLNRQIVDLTTSIRSLQRRLGRLDRDETEPARQSIVPAHPNSIPVARASGKKNGKTIWDWSLEVIQEAPRSLTTRQVFDQIVMRGCNVKNTNTLTSILIRGWKKGKIRKRITNNGVKWAKSS